ncbi:MAG: response regulator [Polyangiaceae bacterium]|nr:response regulator [Polyangiaceae bacterium]
MRARRLDELTLAAPERVAVLIVDDREENVIALSETLSMPGYEIVGAHSGPEALRCLLARDFAVILLDVVMPGMDGFELATLLKKRERSRHTPIIFLTAAAPDHAKIYRGYAIGAVDYMAKPVDPDVVRAKVAVFADLYRKDQRLKRQAEALREAERRERDLAIAELRVAAERRYLNLAEAVPQIVWTAGPDGAITYTNRRWAEYAGPEEVRADGWHWLGALHPEDAERCESVWRGALDTGSECEFECRLRGREASYRWHLCRTVPEHDPQGRIVGYIGTFTDFDELRRALEARDELLAIAAHELRTPLTALKLRVQSLQRLVEADEPARRKVEGAARQCDRLERLLDDLLDVSRITLGQFELQLQDTDLSALVCEVVERTREEAAAAGVALTADVTPGVTGRWDRLRLEQLLTNLVCNAVKYGDSKPAQVVLTADGENANLSVRDNGIGISAADCSRIFERFERTAQSRDLDGLGLGLYIARQIVRAHRGSIQVESELGAGATFLVTLPRVAAVHGECVAGRLG